jgi:FMN phosphatase YigB (HAD superfamily)
MVPSVPDVSACLIDVFETVLSCDFATHAAELPVLAGVTPDVWNNAFYSLAAELNEGRLSMAQAYANVLVSAGISPSSHLVGKLVARDRELLLASARVYDEVVPFLDELRSRGVGFAARDAVLVDDQRAYCDGAMALGIRAVRIVRGERRDPNDANTVSNLLEVLPALRRG